MDGFKSNPSKNLLKNFRGHLFGLVAFKCPHLPFTETLK